MERELKTELQHFLNDLDYDFRHFTLESFVEWIAVQRRRPILLHPMPLPPELFGAWIPGASADYVFYDDGPFQLHATHILLHELSHILLNHQTVPLESHIGQWMESGLTSADPNQLEAALETAQGLCRSVTYTDRQEFEAETLSSLIQSRIFQLAGLHALTQPVHHPGMRQFVEHLGLDR